MDIESLRNTLRGVDSNDPTRASRSFRAIAAAFGEAHASTSSEWFRTECALCALLDDARALDEPTRLAALFVLAGGGSWSGDGSGNAADARSTFATTLREWAFGEKPTSLSKEERGFLRRLHDVKTRGAIADATPERWLGDERRADAGGVETKMDARNLILAPTRFVPGDFKKTFLRPPPLARAFESEMRWFDDDDDDDDAAAADDDAAVSFPGGVPAVRDFPENASSAGARKTSSRLVWDAFAGAPRDDPLFLAAVETKTVLDEASQAPVAPIRQAAVIGHLTRNPNSIVLWGGFRDPGDREERRLAFRDLVEKNPPVAAAAVLAFARVPTARVTGVFDEVLDVLLDSVGVHAMEVVAKVFEERGVLEEGTPRSTLPVDFVIRFIAGCAFRCADAAGENLSVRTRHARLTSMFLQVLLREKYVAVADLPVEVHSFCVEFMSVKETADLFRLVKSLERAAETSGDRRP